MSPPHPLPDPGWPTAEAAAQSRLFSPLRLRSGLWLESRGVVPAMVPWRATGEGHVTPALLDWYARFAEGEPGAIVVEATGVREVPSGPLLRIGHDRYLEGLRTLVERVRAASGGRTRLFIQLIDFLQIRRRPRPEDFFGRFLVITPRLQAALAEELQEAAKAFDDSEERTRQALAALSREALERVLSPRELRDLDYGARQEVNDCEDPAVAELPQRLPGLFADAAARAKAAGFDGVELHYAHAYTMASFLSRTNRRTDGYGGSIAGRLRLPLEVYAAVRRRVGPRFTVGTRFLGDEVIALGSRIEDAVAFGKAFARAGFDYLSISKGGRFEDAKQPKVLAAAYPYTGPSGHECMPTVRIDERGPFDRNLPLARAVREAVRAAGYQTPVVGAGGIAGFSQAEEALRRGDLDLVAAARQSLADPDWWRLIREGQGDRVRRCIFTNYCEGLDQNHKEVTCQLWDKTDLQEVPEELLSQDRKRRLSAPRHPTA